jgi:hypothetical protein
MAIQKEPLSVTHPELAAQADGWDPSAATQGSSKSMRWRCELGHTWNTSVRHRVFGTNCPTCSNKKVLPGFNDLATTHPELAAQADGWDPKTLSANSHKKQNWTCSHGHKWAAVVYSRTFGKGCPFCSGNSVLSGFNDLATTYPELAAQADGWDPRTTTSKSGKKVRWKCSESHTWYAIIGNRIKGVGCPICSGRDVLLNVNDLATTHPELAAQADGWDPKTLKAHSGKKVRWKCPEGHQWTAAVYSRASGIGCPTCARSGFDPNKDGWLYFLQHDDLDMFQIGISNVPDSRLNQHSKRGWEVVEVRGPMKGQLAQQLEGAILRSVERRGAIRGHRTQIENFDGWTEAWTKDSLTVTSFKQLLDWVYEDDQNTHLAR